ncbi:hypothetical protein LJC64_05520 [Ruminococcaceae bacterium OttesenSCG-928-A11]|nr:hypothetical protein [Ruminococcaceae bacterium OttesenSCG-928-A11]
MNKQLGSVNFDFDGAFGFYRAAEDVGIDWDGLRYWQSLNAILGLIRSEYDCPIVIAYHPETELLDDGSMRIVRDEASYGFFTQACLANDIVFLDVGEAFLQAYEADYSVPYGFNNSSMSEGHLNVVGHRIMGEQLYNVLKGLVDT